MFQMHKLLCCLFREGWENVFTAVLLDKDFVVGLSLAPYLCLKSKYLSLCR